MKKLTRSTRNRMLAGVIGGFGEYFEVDPVMLRVIFIFFVLVTGFFPGVIAYVLAMIIMPIDIESARTVDDAPRNDIHDEQKADQ